MKLFPLASLAAVMLELGTFVQANPLFGSDHSNDVTPETCDAFRVTYPVEEGLVFKETDNEVIAWTSPSSVQQVNITLVDATQTVVPFTNVYEAFRGAVGDIPMKLGDAAEGDYHFHLASIGGLACEADSASFKITKEVKHEDDDDKSWSHALQDIGGYVEDKDQHKDEYFTNDDQRTHLNDQIMHELDEISSGHNDVGQWQAEEVAVEAEPQHQDDIDSMFDHSNAAIWSEEELDPKHTDVQGFQAEEHEDDATVHYVTDYSSVGQWQEEQVEDVEPTEHQDADGWVEEVSKFDHSNAGSWHEDEVSVEEPTEHQDVAQWEAEVVDVIAEPEDDGSHINEGQWVDDDDHHEDATEWIAEEVDEHQTSEHKNEAPELESDPEWHMDEVPTGVEWREEGEQEAVTDHTDAAPFLEEEIAHLDDSEWTQHSDATENWFEEQVHNDEVPTGKPASGHMESGETHSNDITAEAALLAKW